jgi:hypothetical protein
LNSRVLMSIRILILVIVLGGFSCNTTEPPPPPPPPPPEPGPTIALEAVDAGVTEAWLRLSIPDTVLARDIALWRDSQLVLSSSLTTSDTVLLDEGLIPNHTYTYKAYRIEDTTFVDTSDAVALTTMDTTSHTFVFDIDTLGGASSSVLLDVAIIDESNIWAVGEVYVYDSTGQTDPLPYNVARFDGTEWRLIRMQVPLFCGPDTSPVRAKSIVIFGPSDVWIATSTTVMRWNGLTFTPLCIPTSILQGSINKMWGDSATSIYCVGNEGTIVHYNGTSWQKLESGTELHVYDVFGGLNPTTGETEVYAVAAEYLVTNDQLILKIDGTSVTEVSDNTIPSSLNGIWFKPGRRYYVVGSGMYTKRDITLEGAWQWLHPGLTPYYTYAIRGNDLNDIVVCGGVGEVLHYNGMSWKSLRGEAGNLTGNCYGIAIKGPICAAVGLSQGQAIIAIGRRP